MFANDFPSLRFPIGLGLNLVLLPFGDNAFFLNVNFNKSVDAHVDVRNPYHGETGDEKAPPVMEKQLIMRDGQHKNRDVMTEAIFAGKKVEKFPCNEMPAVSAAVDTIFTWLAKNFFVRYRPRNAGDWNRKYKQPYDLCLKFHDRIRKTKMPSDIFHGAASGEKNSVVCSFIHA